jgi:hypothetical protein
MGEPTDDLFVDPARLLGDSRRAKVVRQRESLEALTQAPSEPGSRPDDVELDDAVLDKLAYRVVERLRERALWT